MCNLVLALLLFGGIYDLSPQLDCNLWETGTSPEAIFISFPFSISPSPVLDTY